MAQNPRGLELAAVADSARLDSRRGHRITGLAEPSEPGVPGRRGADDERQDRLDALKGLYGRRPFAAIMIAIAMLSLAGLPPLPGFVAKFLIFRNVLDAGHVGLAVAGLVASYLGLYFYLRVIQYMFMNEAEASAARGTPRRYAALASVLCLVPALLLMFFPGWLLDRL